MTSFFSQYPEFVEFDSRKDRGFSQVTIESLDNRHAAMAPKWLVHGKSVLDLGSCIGATGQWCLSNGATHYTGVEVQHTLATTSGALLSKYWDKSKFSIIQQDIRDFLDNQITIGAKYDIIVMIGVIYAFLDTHTILDKLSKICTDCVVIDSVYPWHMPSPDISIIQIARNQHINGSTSDTVFSGAGARPSPAALKIMMESVGFADRDGLIFPMKLSDKSVHESYSTVLARPDDQVDLPARYLMRFHKTNSPVIKQVGDLVKINKTSTAETMLARPTIQQAESWSFDSGVADRFQQEAQNHIPDYSRVIDLCIECTKIVHKSNFDIKIIDVGSALGNTIDKFMQIGYKNVYGVDNSPAMRSKSLHPDVVTISDTLPTGPWDCILANWTLHFIRERREYIQSMYDHLNYGGFVIISDKMEHSMEVEEMYHNFKRMNGVSEDIIQTKKRSLMGVLTPKPLSWYVDTLREIGFVDIQVINTRYMFSTIYARKL